MCPQPLNWLLRTNLCAGAQRWDLGSPFRCTALKIRAQHVLKASATVKWSGGGTRLLLLYNFVFYLDFYYCTIWNFYVRIREKMVCQVTILIESLLPCRSYNYLVMTPNSVKKSRTWHSATRKVPGKHCSSYAVSSNKHLSTQSHLSVCQTATSWSAADRLRRTTACLCASSDSGDLPEHLASAVHERHMQEKEKCVQNHQSKPP